MYLQHFGLDKGLFTTRPVGPEVFVGPQIVTAMDALKKALASPDAVVVFEGPPGVGKTTLVHRALAGLSESWVTVSVGRISLSQDEVLELLLEELGAVPVPNSTVQRFALFRRTLQQFEAADRRVFIVVEDAKRAGTDLLLELEALTAKDAGASGGSSLILMGDTGLDELLRTSELARLKQRLRLRRSIEPLSARETLAYLKHCCRNAGGDFDAIFSAGASDAIHTITGGVTRIVNQVVEAALTTAAERRLSRITPELLGQAAGEQCGLTVELPALGGLADDESTTIVENEPSSDDTGHDTFAAASQAEPEAANDPAADACRAALADAASSSESAPADTANDVAAAPSDGLATAVVDASTAASTEAATDAAEHAATDVIQTPVPDRDLGTAASARAPGQGYPIDVEAGPAAVLPTGLATDQFAPNDLPAFIEETLPDLEELKNALESAAVRVPESAEDDTGPTLAEPLGEEPGTQGLLCLAELPESVDDETAGGTTPEGLPVLTDSVPGMPALEAAGQAAASAAVVSNDSQPHPPADASGLFLASDILPDVDLANAALRSPLTGVTQTNDELPEWDRDPTYAELKPDFDVLEAAIAETQVDLVQTVRTMLPDDKKTLADDEDTELAIALEATLPGDASVDGGLSEDPTVEATLPGLSSLEATIAQNPDADDSAELPQITLDREIEEKISEAKAILSRTHPDLGATVAPGSLPDVPGDADRTHTSDSGRQRMAAELGAAPTLGDVSDTLAETLFGDEFGMTSAQVLGDPAKDAPANDELALVEGEADTDSITEPQPPAPPEPPATSPASAAERPGAGSLRRPQQSPGLDSSQTERLATLQKLRGRPLQMPQPAESVVLGETIVEDQPVATQSPPRSIDEQIDVSITQTLDNLKVQKALNRDNDEEPARKRGFLSRFRKS